MNVRHSLCAVGLTCLALGGCAPKRDGTGSLLRPSQASNEINPEQVEMHDDIVSIHAFYQQLPWLTDADGRVVGFRSTVYFSSGETEKGAFVPGDIFVWLYVLDPIGGGRYERQLAHVWQMSADESGGYRVRKVSPMGYHYGFILSWPRTVDVDGRTIEIEFGYERRNGSVITSPARRFKVPVSDSVTATVPRGRAARERAAPPPDPEAERQP